MPRIGSTGKELITYRGERRQKVCSERASEKTVALAAQGERNREDATRTRGNAVFGEG